MLNFLLLLPLIVGLGLAALVLLGGVTYGVDVLLSWLAALAPDWAPREPWGFWQAVNPLALWRWGVPLVLPTIERSLSTPRFSVERLVTGQAAVIMVLMWGLIVLSLAVRWLHVGLALLGWLYDRSRRLVVWGSLAELVGCVAIIWVVCPSMQVLVMEDGSFLTHLTALGVWMVLGMYAPLFVGRVVRWREVSDASMAVAGLRRSGSGRLPE